MKWASVPDQVFVTLCILNQFPAISEEYYMAVDLAQEEALVVVITKVILTEESFLVAMDQAATEGAEAEVEIGVIVESEVDLLEVEKVVQEDIRLIFNTLLYSESGI